MVAISVTRLATTVTNAPRFTMSRQVSVSKELTTRRVRKRIARRYTETETVA